MRSIQITGSDRILVKPDQVTIYFQIDHKGKEYQEVMEGGNTLLLDVQESLAELSIAKDEIKTLSYYIDQDYEHVKDAEGNAKRVFVGYRFSSRLKLDMPFDNQRLHEVLERISQMLTEPGISIDFSVEDEDAVKLELLEKITKNALAKAERLCNASSVKLGKLTKIDYSWAQVQHTLSFDYGAPKMMRNAAQAQFSFTPEEIEIEDSATFQWEIE